MFGVHGFICLSLGGVPLERDGDQQLILAVDIMLESLSSLRDPPGWFLNTEKVCSTKFYLFDRFRLESPQKGPAN